MFNQCVVYNCAPLPADLQGGKKPSDKVFFCLLMWCRYQDPMLSTAQQMLQDSRSKIELIRLQIIKVTQAGGSTAGSDGGGNQDSFTQGGQNPQSDHLKGLLGVKWVFFTFSRNFSWFQSVISLASKIRPVCKLQTRNHVIHPLSSNCNNINTCNTVYCNCFIRKQEVKSYKKYHTEIMQW